MELNGKNFIITGGKRIGKTVALRMAQEGANIILTYHHSRTDVEQTAEEIRVLGVKALVLQADLAREEDIASIVDSSKKEFGAIHGLIHMAATYERTYWDTITVEQVKKDFDAIVQSAVLLTKHIGPELLKNDNEIKGKIVFFSDWSVLTRPYADYVAYNAAKAAVEALSKTYAKALAPHITVNCIAPGPILRPPDLTEEENNEVMQNILLKRWGGAEEIAKAVMYLLDADFVTGVTIPVDGGRTIA